MDPIVITYQLTLEEFLEGQHIARRTRPFQYWFSRGMLAVVIFTFGVLVLFGDKRVKPDIPVGIGLIVLWIAVIYWVPRRMATKQFRSSRGLQVPKTVAFSPAGVKFRSEVSESQTSWQAFNRCVESASLFLLFASTIQYHTFPKRAFAESDIPRFRALIEQNVRGAM